MKKILALLTAVMLLLSACSSATADGAGKELEDAITNITDADNKYVQMVKGGYRSDDPDTTYEDAFTAFFSAPRWKYFESEDGQDVVEFTGDCTYRDAPVKARIQFVVDEENGTFEAAYLAFNEVPQDMLTLSAVISKAFEEAEASTGSTAKATDTPIGAADNSPLYGEALMQLIKYNMLPDGTSANDLEGQVNGLYDQFAICDIDGDGEKELLIDISSGSTSASALFIYEPNAARTGLQYVWSFTPGVTFYDTGCVKEDWSHNQGLARNFWPYNVYQRTDEGYSQAGSADAWEKNYMDTDFSGNPFPEGVDSDGNGIVYFISGKNGYIDYEHPVDDAEYKKFEQGLLGSAEDIYIPWQSLYVEQVEAATGVDGAENSAADQDSVAISGSTIRFDTEFYSLELPEYWADLCEYSQWDIDPDSFAKSYGITFYEKQSSYDNLGGELFSLALYRGDKDEYYEFPDYLYLGELDVVRLATYDVVATFPTDVQFSEAGQENYLRLSEDIDDILASFAPQSDPECEYTPAA